MKIGPNKRIYFSYLAIPLFALSPVIVALADAFINLPSSSFGSIFFQVLVNPFVYVDFIAYYLVSFLPGSHIGCSFICHPADILGIVQSSLFIAGVLTAFRVLIFGYK